MRLGVVLLLPLMCVLLGGVMIFLPLFWFADPRTPGCSPGDRGWDCGWEYSEAESRKSDQNQHLEGGRVFVHIRAKKSTPSLRYKILK